MNTTKLVVYEIYQEISTPIGTNDALIQSIPCMDTDESGIALFERRLKPRLYEYGKWGKISLIRTTREAVDL